MKKFLVQLLEGIIVGLALGILFFIMDIDATPVQVGVIVAVAILATSFAAAISRSINKEGFLYNYAWVYQHGGNTIVVRANNGEQLYVNGTVVDEKKGVSWNNVELQSQLDTGETITATLSGEKPSTAIKEDKLLKCELQVDGNMLEPVFVML